MSMTEASQVILDSVKEVLRKRARKSLGSTTEIDLKLIFDKQAVQPCSFQPVSVPDV